MKNNPKIRSLKDNLERSEFHKNVLEETLQIAQKTGNKNLSTYQITIYTLIRRIIVLSDEAINCFQSKNWNAAMLCTRAIAETTALLLYLTQNSKDTEGNNVSEDKLQKLISKILIGNTMYEDMPNPIHVNDAIRVAKKKIELFESFYAQLSNFAHPNAQGLYSTLAKEDSFISVNFNDSLSSESLSKIVAGPFLRVCLAQSVTVLHSEKMLAPHNMQ